MKSTPRNKSIYFCYIVTTSNYAADMKFVNNWVNTQHPNMAVRNGLSTYLYKSISNLLSGLSTGKWQETHI